jgi:hypothetical protein
MRTLANYFMLVAYFFQPLLIKSMYVSPKINADRLAASVSLTEGGVLLVTYA